MTGAGSGQQGPAARLLTGRRLYLCTPDRADLAAFVEACIEGGVDVVQLREKRLEARPLLGRALLVRAVCRDRGVPFVLNDRPDLALEVDADGVHVGQDDAPVSLARRILGPDRLVGLSTHSPAELAEALGARGDASPDYLSAGPVVPTPTKPGRPGTGPAYLSAVAAAITARRDEGAGEIPWFVTGGVQPSTVPGLVAAGARRFVVVRFLTESPDPRRSARELRDAIERALDAA